MNEIPNDYIPQNAEDSLKYENAVNKTEEKLSVVFGLPLIKLFKEIEICPNDNKINIFFRSSPGAEYKKSTSIMDNKLYMKHKINNIDFISWLDTGVDNDDLIIYNHFYQRNKEHFPLKSLETNIQNMMSAGGVSQLEYFTSKPINIDLGNKNFSLNDAAILTENDNNRSNFIDNNTISDGIMFGEIFRQFNKVTLNFENMWSSFE